MILLTSILLAPTLALALALPATAPLSHPHPLLSASTSPILCYDSRLATHAPPLSDCAQIIKDHIAKPRSPISMPITFSTHPTGTQQGLPVAFWTERRECVVVVDIPDTPSTMPLPTTDQASMLDIKQAAFEVLRVCVARGQHLGGFVQAGMMEALQVRVEAGPNARGVVVG